MSSLSQFLTQEHHHCDDHFAAAENAVAQADWPQAQTAFAQFTQETRQHFSHEEDILFPAFESLTGMSGGPTAVMREEHLQMNNVIAAMASALQRRDGDAYLGLSETLLMLMRQHNMKEENILYPMTDQALAAETTELLARMATPQA